MSAQSLTQGRDHFTLDRIETTYGYDTLEQGLVRVEFRYGLVENVLFERNQLILIDATFL